jgi:putative ABC transport system ATP-binding protein/lipoprotein-releasing system ATP-binding protein
MPKNSDSSAPLELRDVSFAYENSGGAVARYLFNGLNLAVPAGTSLAIVGPSGSGKSTLLMLCMGLLTATSGEVVVDGVDLAQLSERQRTKLRRQQIGMVFQDGELLPELSPLENVAVPLMLAGEKSSASLAASARALDLVGISSKLHAADTITLSGGERQRVAVARAIVQQPKLLLADEPTGALDGSTRDKVADELFSIPGKTGAALLVVTHDPAIASRATNVLDVGAFIHV